jgi:hypothetical protein
MMNTLTFVAIVALGEIVVVWLAYSLGHQSGWLAGWEERREKH